MECSKTNEKIIENEYCDIFPNQVFMEENRSLQTQSNAIQNQELEN
jgi:hypothetical protein